MVLWAEHEYEYNKNPSKIINEKEITEAKNYEQRWCQVMCLLLLIKVFYFSYVFYYMWQHKIPNKNQHLLVWSHAQNNGNDWIQILHSACCDHQLILLIFQLHITCLIIVPLFY